MNGVSTDERYGIEHINSSKFSPLKTNFHKLKKHKSFDGENNFEETYFDESLENINN